MFLVKSTWKHGAISKGCIRVSKIIRAIEIILIVMLVVTLLTGCGKVSAWNEQNREEEEQRCRINWGDSGYEHRVVSYKEHAASELLYHKCQVKVGDRWVPEDSVKVGSVER